MNVDAAGTTTSTFARSITNPNEPLVVSDVVVGRSTFAWLANRTVQY